MAIKIRCPAAAWRAEILPPRPRPPTRHAPPPHLPAQPRPASSPATLPHHLPTPRPPNNRPKTGLNTPTAKTTSGPDRRQGLDQQGYIMPEVVSIGVSPCGQQLPGEVGNHSAPARAGPAPHAEQQSSYTPPEPRTSQWRLRFRRGRGRRLVASGTAPARASVITTQSHQRRSDVPLSGLPSRPSRARQAAPSSSQMPSAPRLPKPTPRLAAPTPAATHKPTDEIALAPRRRSCS